MEPTIRRRTTRLVAILSVASLLPLLILAAISATQTLRREKLATEQEALSQVRRLSEMLDRELRAQLTLIDTLSTLPEFDDLDHPEEVARVLQGIKERQPMWMGALLARPDGSLVAAVQPPAQGRVVDADSLRHVVETRRPTIGNIVRGPVNAAFAVRAPVIRDERVIGVVSAVVRPEAVGNLLIGARMPPGWIALVSDEAGNFVARTAGDGALIGTPISAAARAARDRGGNGMYDGLTIEGEPTVAAYWVSPLTNWSVHIAVPRSLFNAGVTHLAWLIGAGTVVSIMLAGLFIWLLIREIRARREHDRTIETARRVELLGRLTASVAHDFNNLLMVVLGGVQTLERRLQGQSPDVMKRIAQIKRAAEAGSQLTRQLAVFSRQEKGRTERLDLNARIRSIEGMLRHAARAEQTLELELAPGLPQVELDPLQLDLALLNLVANARDATPDGGRIVIRTALGAARAGVTLSVADTGAGIPKDILPRVLEPFFTTKETAKGTGLGLTQVHRFATGAGGALNIESAPGAGTTIAIYLPASAARPADAQASAGSGSATPRAAGESRRVLLVDDDPDVREVTAEHLIELGYTVFQVDSVAAAIAALEQSAIDIVVSDIVMPGAIDGVGLARIARRGWPSTPVLLISAFSTATQTAQREGFALLPKPFTDAELDGALGRLAA